MLSSCQCFLLLPKAVCIQHNVMDPVSLAGLGLQTLQLTLQSVGTLQQFIRDTRHVNATVRELAFEIRSLERACRVVHQQLQALAAEYEDSGKHGDAQPALWDSIQKELESCKKTLNTLRSALTTVRRDSSNFMQQGWRQLKLNMKQEEIAAMKGRIQSHTAALQVCLLVMDINVSHLAPRKVGEELKTKLNDLETRMFQLQQLVRAHFEKVDLVLENGALTMASTQEEIADNGSEGSSCADGSAISGADSLVDSETDFDAQSVILACAQETLSRGTSLYEGSVYEPSVISSRTASTGPIVPVRRSAHESKVPQPVEVQESAKSSLVVPSNLPASLRQSFCELQRHLNDQGQVGAVSGQPECLRPARETSVDVLQPVPDLGRSPRTLREVLAKTRASVEAEKSASRLRESHFGSRERQPLKVSPSNLSYTRHIEHELLDETLREIAESRSDILEALVSSGTLNACRVALSGRLGIGKTTVAICAIQGVIQQNNGIPIFWVSVPELKQDCQEICSLLGLRPLGDDVRPWNWLCKLVRRLPTSIVGQWLVVIDGANADGVRATDLEKLAETEIGSGYIVLTTRVRSYAEAFAGKQGLHLEVGQLDPLYAANLLSEGSASPTSGAFDGVALLLDFEPHAIASVKGFLEQTRMSIEDFEAQLRTLIQEESWQQDGCATAAACLLPQWGSGTRITLAKQTADASILLPVMRCCFSPRWPIVFNELHRQDPAACELLGVLSAVGRSELTTDLMFANDSRRAGTAVLVDHCILSQHASTLKASRLTLLAHRLWLLSRNDLPAAYNRALSMVASDYPEESSDPDWSRCVAFEPLAVAVTSPTAGSWMDGSDTSRWFKSMLLQKRSRFFRDSGTNKWEGDELEAAEVMELQAIHRMVDCKEEK